MNNIYKTLITCGILILFGAIIGIFIIVPAISDIRAFNDRIQWERVNLENKYTNRRNVKNIIADLKYVESNISAIEEKIIVAEGKEVEFITKLEKIAKKNNLTEKISISAPSDSDKEKVARKKNIAITLSGDYNNFLNYLSELEQSDAYVNINNIYVATAKEKSSQSISSGAVKVSLQGYAYFSL